MTIAWRIEDFPDPFTPVIKFTRAFGSIVNEPWVMKFSNVILQMFPSLYWLWKRFVGKSNWGRNRGELVFDDVRTGVLWFDEFFARFFGVVAEIFSLLGLFLEDILFAHADKVSEHWTYAMRRHHSSAQTTPGKQPTTCCENWIGEFQKNITQPLFLIKQWREAESFLNFEAHPMNLFQTLLQKIISLSSMEKNVCFDIKLEGKPYLLFNV